MSAMTKILLEAGITTGVAATGIVVAKNEDKIVEKLHDYNKKARKHRRKNGNGEFDKKIDKEEQKLSKQDQTLLNELTDAFNNAFQGTLEVVNATDEHHSKKKHHKHHHSSKREEAVATDVTTGDKVVAEVVAPVAPEAPTPVPNPVLNPDGTVMPQFTTLQNQ